MLVALAACSGAPPLVRTVAPLPPAAVQAAAPRAIAWGRQIEVHAGDASRGRGEGTRLEILVEPPRDGDVLVVADPDAEAHGVVIAMASVAQPVVLAIRERGGGLRVVPVRLRRIEAPPSAAPRTIDAASLGVDGIEVGSAGGADRSLERVVELDRPAPLVAAIARAAYGDRPDVLAWWIDAWTRADALAVALAATAQVAPRRAAIDLDDDPIVTFDGDIVSLGLRDQRERRLVLAAAPALVECWLRGRYRDPSLAESLAVAATINGGRAHAPTISPPVGDEVTACVAQALGAISFPRSEVDALTFELELRAVPHLFAPDGIHGSG